MDVTGAVYGWLRPSYWNGIISYDPEALAKRLSEAALSKDVPQSQRKASINAWALAASVLAESASQLDQSTNEWAAVVAALGYLLVNIRVHHSTYLNGNCAPYNAADLQLLEEAEESYFLLKSRLMALNPTALEHVRPMTGEVKVKTAPPSGITAQVWKRWAEEPPTTPWEGTWKRYPLWSNSA